MGNNTTWGRRREYVGRGGVCGQQHYIGIGLDWIRLD